MLRSFTVAIGLLLLGCFPGTVDAQRLRVGRAGVSIHFGGPRGVVVPRLPPYGYAHGFHRNHFLVVSPSIVYRPVDVAVYQPLPIAVYESRRVDFIAKPRVVPPRVDFAPPIPDDDLIPVAPSVEELADQLRRAARLLELSLQNRYPGQDDWLNYLAPQQILGALDGSQPIDSLRELHQRYEMVMQHPKYRSIHSIIGFQVTHQILSQFVSVALEPPLDVPPPPVGSTEHFQLLPERPVVVEEEGSVAGDSEAADHEQSESVEELPAPLAPTTSI